MRSYFAEFNLALGNKIFSLNNDSVYWTPVQWFGLNSVRGLIPVTLRGSQCSL